MKFPDDSKHLSIMGANGSGKTQYALWVLSNRDYVNKPWVIVNYKNDELVDGIPGAIPLPLDEIPNRPGIFITHPIPEVDDAAVTNQLWAIWERGNTGVYIDEGYMIGNRNPAFRALLTQGRSKKIPLIVLTQRPVWADPFVFTESRFFQVFRLQHMKDVKKVEEFIPGPGGHLAKRLPPYHSYHYNVDDDEFLVLGPVENIETIYQRFALRMPKPRRNL